MVMGFSTGVESLLDWVLCCLTSFDDWTTVVVDRLSTRLRVVVGRLPTGPYVVVGLLTTGPYVVVGRLTTGPYVAASPMSPLKHFQCSSKKTSPMRGHFRVLCPCVRRKFVDWDVPAAMLSLLGVASFDQPRY